ncbi:hypothetical protein PHMEG_0003982 [Phytophthora megakarya]|uniref:Uncharacterized protein n=1 Tax=Phytophthora megakarya TaxID=4795 RepID=A0A225WWK2_9STRA|nr:hypothetical protein PHMEG_0003982 [Phytophthora megakarya]
MRNKSRIQAGAAMHANDGSLTENWLIEQGGWQLDRVNKTSGYMLDTTQADQKVARVLSDLKPKDGAKHLCLRVLEEPSISRALKLQGILFAITLVFSGTPLNRDEVVAQVLKATLVMHYPDMLMLSDSNPFIGVGGDDSAVDRRSGGACVEC